MGETWRNSVHLLLGTQIQFFFLWQTTKWYYFQAPFIIVRRKIQGLQMSSGWFTPSLTNSLAHSLTHSFVHSFIHVLLFILYEIMRLKNHFASTQTLAQTNLSARSACHQKFMAKKLTLNISEESSPLRSYLLSTTYQSRRRSYWGQKMKNCSLGFS